MTKDDEFLLLVERAFPREPIPCCFFWKNCDKRSGQDITEELSARIEQRSWKEITIMDWRMIGAPPVIARSYLEPRAFIYYIPSIIVGVLQENAYIEFALEAIVPFNKFHITRGAWWSEFSDAISPLQRESFSEFLLRTRRETWNEIGLTNQALVQIAERIWSGSEK